MSYDLGHSRRYVNNISSGKSMPNIRELFSICEYFDITVQDFFDENKENPALIQKVTEEVLRLSEDDILLILTLINKING